MRKKRLQNVAEIMCQMFCGWRLIASKPNLVKLGSGTLDIDAVSGRCLFQEKNIEQLAIAEEIRDWLRRELDANNIPILGLACARLTVKLSFSEVPWNEQTKEVFYSDGKAVRTERMNRCTMECNSDVATDELSYRSKLVEIQEWPTGWPADSSDRLRLTQKAG
jgi:hypothetical protein